MPSLTALKGARPIEQTPKRANLPDTYPKGRTCSHKGCETVLSIYNPGARCYTHQKPRRKRASWE